MSTPPETRTIHLAESSSIHAGPICKAKGIPFVEQTRDILKATCPDCLPCEHAMTFIRETRARALELFVSIEQIHCHSCSSIWELPT